MKRFMKMWLCVIVIIVLVVTVGAVLVVVSALLFDYSTSLGCIALFIMVTAIIAMLLDEVI